MTTTTKKTAEQTTRENARDIEAILDFIGMEMRARIEEWETDGLNWATAGSTGHWKSSLKEVLISVMGAHDESEADRMIEDALDDAKA